MKKSVVLIGFVALSSFAISGCKDSGKLNNGASEASMVPGGLDEKLKIAITPQAVEHGHASYLSNCSACHGATGQGNGPAAAALATKPRDHTNGAYMDKLSNKHIYNVIKMGGAMYGFPTMPAQPNLKDEEIKELVAYIRTISNTYKGQ